VTDSIDEAAEAIDRYEPPRLIMLDANTIEPQTVRWLWPGRIALRKITLLASDPGLGKSLVTIDLVARVTRGKLWPLENATAPEGSALILSAEDDPADTMVPRLMAADADLLRVKLLDCVRETSVSGNPFDRGFSLERDVQLLERELSLMPDCRLIVVDPISAYLGGTDTHRNADVRALLTPLIKLAQRHDVAIIAVSHLNKGTGLHANYRVTGSIAFTATARAVYLIAKDPDDPKRRLIMPIKNNLAEDETGLAYRINVTPDGIAFIEWDDQFVSVTPDEVFNPDPDSSAKDEAMAFLLDILGNGPASAKVVLAAAREAGIAERTLHRAKKALRVVSGKSNFDSGWVWILSPTIAPKVAKIAED
jgi:putative DNA primase/helicase